jgi:hypothetical protein
MFSYYPMTDTQAQPSPLAHLFGGEKGSNRCPRFSSAIPGPSSAKEALMISPALSVVIVRLPLLCASLLTL